MSGVEVRSAGSSSSPQPGCRRAGESRWASPATRRRGVWPLFGARVARVPGVHMAVPGSVLRRPGVSLLGTG